jgi:pyrroline-5-carboxylate reductase
MSKVYTHGFIGCGKMAQIILQAMLKHQRAIRGQVAVSRRNLPELKKLRRQFGVSATNKNTTISQNSRIIWLGIKPFQAKTVLAEIADLLRPGSVVVSMMAGVSTAMIRKYLRTSCPVLRIMPNTPALLGQGVTGAFFTPGFPRPAKKKLTQLLQDLGQVVMLKSERQFDAVTGLSGSGPAFVYLIAEGLLSGGREAGLSLPQARTLAIQTLVGAAAMLKETGQDPEKLIAQVLSKGGTTEAGLKVLKKFRVEVGVKKAVRSAARRSKEISRKLK